MLAIIKSATRARELRQAQCVYLAATTDWTNEQIATLLGLSPATVRQMLYLFRKQGMEQVAADDHGYQRRHAALTLAQEQEFLARLWLDQQAGLPITASQGLGTLKEMFGKDSSVSKPLVYNIFYRHGWSCDGTQGAPESEFFPPPNPLSPDSALMSVYTPKNVTKPRTTRQNTPTRVSDEVAHALLDTLEAHLVAGQAVTTPDAQQQLQAAHGIALSRQSTQRLFWRHGWKQHRFEGRAFWTIGPNVNLTALQNSLRDRHASSLLSTSAEAALLADLETQMLAHDTPVTIRLVAHHLQALCAHSVSAGAARKLLLRNGWRQVRTHRFAAWVRGNPPNLSAILGQLETSAASLPNLALSPAQAQAIIEHLHARHASRERITVQKFRHAVEQFFQTSLSAGTAAKLLRKHGWTLHGKTYQAHWLPPEHRPDNAA